MRTADTCDRSRHRTLSCAAQGDDDLFASLYGEAPAPAAGGNPNAAAGAAGGAGAQDDSDSDSDDDGLKIVLGT